MIYELLKIDYMASQRYKKKNKKFIKILLHVDMSDATIMLIKDK